MRHNYTMNIPRHFWILTGLMALFTALRWPEMLPWNFSPVYAIFLCAGVFFRDRRLWLLPVGFMLISDLLMNALYYQPLGFSVFQPKLLVSYALYLGLACLGSALTDKARFGTLLAGGLLGGSLFYLATNTLSWAGDAGYAKTWAGWVQSITTGKPGFHPPAWVFFRNSAVSGALFTAVIVLAVQLARRPAEDEKKFELA